MQERSDPLANVCWAAGPGWIPFKIYQRYYSHSSMTHVALEFVCVSRLFLGILSSPIYGDSSPILAFQSPHMTEFVVSGIFPMTSSI
jgi:hypothetical protein